MSLSATMHNMSSIFHLLIVGLTVVGCAHRVVIESDPPGATIRVGHKTVGVTPAEVKVRWVPFKKTPVTLSIPGKRRVQLNLSKDLGPMRLGWQARLPCVGTASVHSVNSTLNHGLALLAHRARRGVNGVKNVEKRRPLAAFKAG